MRNVKLSSPLVHPVNSSTAFFDHWCVLIRSISNKSSLNCCKQMEIEYFRWNTFSSNFLNFFHCVSQIDEFWIKNYSFTSQTNENSLNQTNTAYFQGKNTKRFLSKIHQHSNWSWLSEIKNIACKTKQSRIVYLKTETKINTYESCWNNVTQSANMNIDWSSICLALKEF